MHFENEKINVQSEIPNTLSWVWSSSELSSSRASNTSISPTLMNSFLKWILQFVFLNWPWIFSTWNRDLLGWKWEHLWEWGRQLSGVRCFGWGGPLIGRHLCILLHIACVVLISPGQLAGIYPCLSPPLLLWLPQGSFRVHLGAPKTVILRPGKSLYTHHVEQSLPDRLPPSAWLLLAWPGGGWVLLTWSWSYVKGDKTMQD